MTEARRGKREAGADTGARPASVKAAFGEANRKRLLKAYFDQRGNPTGANAWRHIYRLLLWIDRTTGLAHCYESDKSQPGRHWYDRSLAFHAWIAAELEISPASLAVEIDWLFKRAIEDFAAAVESSRERRAAAAERQRAQYEGRGMPVPGEDAELISIIRDELHPFLREGPPQELWRNLVEQLRGHMTLENKRKNLVGEGFEDAIAAVVSRIPSAWSLSAQTRIPIEEIRGFNATRANEKPKKVDLFVQNEESGFRTLISAKWSVRADREEQFASDFEAYARLEAAGEPFDYTLLTNEFDPARLLAACERRSGGHVLFTKVVHINPDGLRAAYGTVPKRSAEKVLHQIEDGRLISFGAWLGQISGIG